MIVISGNGSKVRSLVNSSGARPATKVAFGASIQVLSGKTPLQDR